MANAKDTSNTTTTTTTTTANRSCLAVVEADGLFEGRRRVRLLLPSSSSDSDTRVLQRALVEALCIDTTSSDPTLEIEWYNPRQQIFQPFTSLGELPSNCCRLRITQAAAVAAIEEVASSRLALPWREFSESIDTDGRLILGSHVLKVCEASNSGLGTGTNLWDGAIALVRFLEEHDNTQTEDDYSLLGKSVLELGAGTGLVGIAAHVAFGASRVVVTDLEYSMANLEANLETNDCRTTSMVSNSTTIDASVLDWFDTFSCDRVLADHGVPDVVLAADVVWVEELVQPLVETLRHICAGATATPPIVLLSYQRRSQAVGDLLFRTLEESSFRVEDVTTESILRSKIRIYRIAYVPTA